MKAPPTIQQPVALDLDKGQTGNNESQDHLNLSSVSPMNSNRDLLHVSNLTSQANRQSRKFSRPTKKNVSDNSLNRLSFNMKYGATTPKPDPSRVMSSSFRKHMTLAMVEDKDSDETPVFDEQKEFESYRKQETKKSKIRKKKSLRNKSLLSTQKDEISSATFESDDQDKSVRFYEPNGLDLSERSRSFEFWRRRFTISRTNVHYQMWKGVAIIISFLASFKYGLVAVFLDKMTEEDVAFFENEDLIYVSIFIFDMIIHMALDEHPYQEGPWTLKESLRKQLKNGLLVEVLSVLPLSRLFEGILKPKLCQLLYMVRCIRIFIGLDLLDYKKYKHQIQEAMNKRIAQRLVDPEQANDQNIDSAKMDLIVMITQILKTFRLIILILCLSYFTGLAWLVFCQFGLDNREVLGKSDPHQQYFVEEFGFEDRDKMMTSVSLAYFIFTTLSTVGFGDFHPKSNGERIVCSFVMLFGVMIASVLMDNFSTMLKELQNLNKNYEETERFNIFLGTMKRYNGELRLPDWLEQKMENYLQYRWVHNRNQAISTEEDVDLFEQLPGRVQTQIYVEFLFKHFMEVYKHLFDLHQYAYGIKRKQKFSRLDTTSMIMVDYTHIDTTKYFSHYLYDEFIVNLVRQLEPIEVSDGQILLRQEVENVSEIYLMMKGEIMGGYNHKRYVLELDIDTMEMPLEKGSEAYSMVKSKIAQNLVMKMQQLKTFDQKYFFPVRINPGFAIGLFEVEFGQQSQFLYQVRVKKTSDESRYRNDCYFIRKSNWFKIQLGGEESQKEWSNILNYMKSNIMINYLKKVHLPIQNYRNRWLSHENRRMYEEYKRSANKTNLLKSVPGTDKKLSKASGFHSTFKSGQLADDQSDNGHEGDELMNLQSMRKDTVQQFDSIEHILEQIRNNQLLKVHSVRHQMNLFHIRQEIEEDEPECVHQYEALRHKIDDHQNQVASVLARYCDLQSANEELRRENLELRMQLRDEQRTHAQQLNLEKRKTEALRNQLRQLQGELLDRKATLNMQLPHNITEAEADPNLAAYNQKFCPSKQRFSESLGRRRGWEDNGPGLLTARAQGRPLLSQEFGLPPGLHQPDRFNLDLNQVQEEQSLNQSRLVGHHLSNAEYSLRDITLDEGDQDIFHIKQSPRHSLNLEMRSERDNGQMPEFNFNPKVLQNQASQETLGAKPVSPEKYDASKPLDEEFGFRKIDMENGRKTDEKRREHLELKFKFGENQDRSGPFVIQIDNESPDKVKLLDERLAKAPTISQSRNVRKIQEETSASNRSVTYNDFIHTQTAKHNSNNHIEEEAGGRTVIVPSMGESPDDPPEQPYEVGLSQSYSLPGVTQHHTANFAGLLKSQSSKDEGFHAKNTLKGNK